MIADLVGMSGDGLRDLVGEWGFKPGQAERLLVGIHRGLVAEFRDIPELNRGLLAKLDSSYSLALPKIIDWRCGADGTEKWLLGLANGHQVETVFIPKKDRGTLCLSSQAGCTLNCSFCHTGTMGFTANLSSSEIVGQALLVRRHLAGQGRVVTNVVMMGMGEPLYNWPAVRDALKLIGLGLGLVPGSRKISVSTVGVVPNIGLVAEELGANLIISLHATTDEVRNVLVPLNRKYPLASLQAVARTFPLTGKRTISWAYMLLAGVNDSALDAERLVEWLARIPSRVNILTFNSWPGTKYRSSAPQVAEEFRQILHTAGIITTYRQSRGGDIGAACGQLAGKKNSQKTN